MDDGHVRSTTRGNTVRNGWLAWKRKAKTLSLMAKTESTVTNVTVCIRFPIGHLSVRVRRIPWKVRCHDRRV